MLLKFPWSETYKNRPSKVKVVSFCAAHQGWEKEAWNLVGFFGFRRQYAHLGILLTRQPIRLSVLRGVQARKGSIAGPGCHSRCPATWTLWHSTSNGIGNVHGRQRCFIDFGLLQQNDSARSWGLGIWPGPLLPITISHLQSNYWLATRP